MSANTLIAWSNDLSVGIGSIDSQHQKLVNMINALNEALIGGESTEVLNKIFAGLLVYTDKHFTFEEAMFSEHGYPESAAHKAQHDALKGKVVELKEKLDSGAAMIGTEVMAFLKDWLTNHIMKQDMAYAPFLKSKGVN